MLDKTLPYAEIWMTRPLQLPVPMTPLAEGFEFRTYQKGDESAWSEIETSVGEFQTTDEALEYFQKNFAPYPEELERRMFFVETKNGEKVATCTAWRKKSREGVYPVFHWLAVKPVYQGKGLAKALTAKVLQEFPPLHTDGPIYLHTQTWSHQAIALYKKMGFSFIAENLDGTPNPDYEKVMQVLSKLDK
ncbi:GNAT family N-acetyltransferase [Enterococcus faecium]|nr:GNAT family N-acetyltransferase [Enterococcus faecium]